MKYLKLFEDYLDKLFKISKDYDYKEQEPYAYV